jgi:hypothetical protein
MTKPPPFGHLEIDWVEFWEGFGKELKSLKTPTKSHRINGPSYLHNPKVVSSNLTLATLFTD